MLIGEDLLSLHRDWASAGSGEVEGEKKSRKEAGGPHVGDAFICFL